jgi:hypothetical protein
VLSDGLNSLLHNLTSDEITDKKHWPFYAHDFSNEDTNTQTVKSRSVSYKKSRSELHAWNVSFN